MNTYKYEMKDYSCLYYLLNKVDDKAMCKFFCGLGTIFGLNESEISKSSILFAGATKILFNGKGFSEADIKKYGGSVFKRPFTNCQTLSRWHITKDFDMLNNCCIVCHLSDTYKNALVDHERLLIRSTIHTGKIELESEKFYSVVSIKPGNDISEYPVIPFLSILDQFFIDDNTNSPYDDKEALIASFSEYLCVKLNYSEPKDKEIILNCVKREINDLYDYDFSILNDRLVNQTYCEFLPAYNYNAPKVMRSDASVETPTITPAPAKKKRKKDIYNINQDVLVPMENSSKAGSPDKSIPDNRKKSKDTSQESPAEIKQSKRTTPDGAKCRDADLKLISDSSHKITNTECIESVYNNDTECDNVTKSILDVSMLSYPHYSVPKELTNKITYCSSSEPKSVLTFITDICSSQNVSVESVVLNKRHGLLFMTMHSHRFYFYDLEYAPSGYLYPALSDTSKIKLLSLNPLPVISMFHKLGFSSLQIDNLCGLYWLYNSRKTLINYSDMFNGVLSVNNDKEEDFYYFYMPYYEQLYTKLNSYLSENNKDTLLEEYRKGIKLESVLGMNYDLSDILYGLTNSVSGHGFFDYQFNYYNDIPYIKKGILYVVNFPELEEKDQNNINDLLETIAIQVHKSSAKYVCHAKLITFMNKGIVYYSTMYGDIFFDILLDIVRRNYNKCYGKTPVLKTYRVEYK